MTRFLIGSGQSCSSLTHEPGQMAGAMSAVPIFEYENQCCATSDLSFLPVEQRGKLHERCARLLNPGGGKRRKALAYWLRVRDDVDTEKYSWAGAVP